MATVTEIQTQAQTVASNALTQANTYIQALQAQATDVFFDTELPNTALWLLSDQMAQEALDELTAGAPTRPTIPSSTGLEAPVSPDSPSFSAITTLAIPEFVENLPTLNLPTAPSSSLPGAPGNAPEFLAPALPDRPVFSLPDVPTFTPIEIPEVAATSMPTFTTDLPLDEMTELTSAFEYSENDYSSTLLDETKAKILDDLLNGGYGIDTADEDALWNRAREREMVNAQVAIDNLASLTAGRGFPLPNGAFFYAAQAAAQDALEKNSSVNRDIAIKRGDMYVENRRFIIEQARQVEAMLIQYFGAKAERALNAAKALSEVSISLFDVRVKRYNVRLEAYKAAAQVYETKIRAEMGKLETYKTRIEAARLAEDVQKLHVDVYNSQLGGLKILVDMYETEMSASRIASEIEKAKIDAFKASVDAYLGQVQARTAEFQMYEAQIRGETTKISQYEAQIKGYNARLDGLQTRARIEETRAKTEIAQYDAELTRYRTELEKYRTDIQRVVGDAELVLKAFDSDVKLYATTSSATQKGMELDIAIQKANADVLIENLKAQIQRARSQLELLVKQYELRLEGTKAGAVIYANTALGALNQLTAIASKSE